jgi:hypothetical protein
MEFKMELKKLFALGLVAGSLVSVAVAEDEKKEETKTEESTPAPEHKEGEENKAEEEKK